RRLLDSVACETVGLQERASVACVRPYALLDAGDHDDAPFEPLGPVRGEQAYRGAADARFGKWLGRDLLFVQFGEELRHPSALIALLGARGGIEQRADRVEVAVCVGGTVTAFLSIGA